jgi:hypothetical protein
MEEREEIAKIENAKIKRADLILEDDRLLLNLSVSLPAASKIK